LLGLGDVLIGERAFRRRWFARCEEGLRWILGMASEEWRRIMLLLKYI